MAVGVALALWYMYRQAKNQGLDANRLLDAAFYIIMVSLFGAKLILFSRRYFLVYPKYPKELFWIARSGGVFQGGLAFGIVFALWYLRRRGFPTWKVADIAAPALALGHGFGRIGCFMAGCCYGKECALPWGVTFHDAYANQLTGIPLNQPLHPVQLYESGLNFPNFLVLTLISEKKDIRRPGFPAVYRQLFGHPLLHRILQRRSSRQGLPVQRDVSLLTVSYPQFFCILGLAAGILLS